MLNANRRSRYMVDKYEGGTFTYICGADLGPHSVQAKARDLHLYAGSE